MVIQPLSTRLIKPNFCSRFTLFEPLSENSQFRFCCLLIFTVFFFWPGRGFDRKGDLKPDGQAILLMALTSLQDAMCTLQDGTIQYQLLMLIRDNFDRFLMLCQEMDKEGHENVRQSLNQRLAELRAFEVEREQVIGLLGMCNLMKGGNSFIT